MSNSPLIPRVPPVLKRGAWMFALATPATVMIAIVWVRWQLWLSGSSWIGAVAGPVAIFLPQTAVLVVVRLRLRRLRRVWEESGGRVCVRCGHNLSGLGERGLCPECGGEFDVFEDGRSWRAAGMGRKRAKGRNG